MLSRGQEAALAMAWVPPAPPGMELAAQEQGQDKTRGTKPVLSEAPMAEQVGAMCTLSERRRRRAVLQPCTELETCKRTDPCPAPGWVCQESS